ncbi:MAG: N-acetylglucosamine-6-phosphate deacetylase [Elusimicrobiaceae bacterium]|nr:N-acetylglucosamine-6-phosphate deacetylase [Elusimicrobiaceae bacterium]
MSLSTLGPVDIITADGLQHNVAVCWENNKITQITPQLAPAKDLPLVVPAFIDLHIHGMGGFGPEQGTPESLLHMSRVLALQGTTAFCPTLYCASPERIVAQLRALLPALGHEQGARILGFHLEGPFISPEKPGVMRPQDIAPANLDEFKKIYDASQGHITIVTLAPEIPGIDPIIRFCLEHQIVVQAGHTNATYEQMQIAFDNGIKRVTHLGNAMSGMHHRSPGVLGAVLDNPAISCEVIADAKHVHPALLHLLKRVKPVTQICAVTDALLPTEQLQGPFYANNEEVVMHDQIWTRQHDGVIAGSALTMPKAFKTFIQAGYSLQEAALCTSINAARVVNLPTNGLQIGAPANMVLLNSNFTLRQVFLNGHPV